MYIANLNLIYYYNYSFFILFVFTYFVDGKIRLVVEQYHNDGTQHNVFKHISFVFS